MARNVNLLKLELDPLARIKVYRSSYESSSTLDEIRTHLVPGQFVTRLGDRVWGYSLPESIVERFKFKEATHLAVALKPRFVNSLLRYAIGQRLEYLGYRRVGYDRFEQSDDIAFSLGDRGELVAQTRWLVRPFSLPTIGDEGHSVFALLANPRLAYRFADSLAQLSEVGFHWKDFGSKVRAVSMEQVSQGGSPWEKAHTASIIENKGIDGLLCEWRDGQRQIVSLAVCWPLANTENRYHYLRRRYPGTKGEMLATGMKSRDDGFFALKNVHLRVKALGESINRVNISSDLQVSVGDFLEVEIVSPNRIDELQTRFLEQVVDEMPSDEIKGEDGEDDDYSEEVVQLELF